MAAARAAAKFRRAVAGAAAWMAAATCACAAAGVDPAFQRYVFDIPAQPLAAALGAYAQVTGESLFFDGELAAGKHSARVSGELAAGAALNRLLDGTRLVALYTPAGMLTLRDTGGTPDCRTSRRRRRRRSRPACWRHPRRAGCRRRWSRRCAGPRRPGREVIGLCYKWAWILGGV